MPYSSVATNTSVKPAVMLYTLFLPVKMPPSFTVNTDFPEQ